MADLVLAVITCGGCRPPTQGPRTSVSQGGCATACADVDEHHRLPVPPQIGAIRGTAGLRNRLTRRDSAQDRCLERRWPRWPD
jgi:hypothetical protein